MARSVNEWFEERGGRGSWSADDELVEYQGGHLGPGSTPIAGGTSGNDRRGDRRPVAGRPKRQTSHSRGRAADARRIRQDLLQAQRDGRPTATAAVVAALARSGVKVTAAQVEATKADLRAESRKAFTSNGKSGPEKQAGSPATGSPRSNKKTKLPKAKIIVPIGVVITAPKRTKANPGPPRSEGIERGPAELSPFRGATPNRTAASSRKRKPQTRTADERQSTTQRRDEARDGGARRLARRALPVIEVEPCPACGLRPTINGVCLC